MINTFLSKHIVRWMRKGRMPSKHGNHQYYKGTGGGAMGHYVRANYVIDPKKVRQWMIPSMLDFSLKAYVSHTVDKVQCKDAIKTVQDYIDNSRSSL